MQNQNIVTVKNLHKSFRVGQQDVVVLKELNFEIKQGDFVIILGPSGCGKSTLLHILLGLEPPTRGEITFLDQNIYSATTEDDRAQFRKQHVGMVFQQANWIKSLKVIENVAFPLLLLGQEKPRTLIKAYDLLKKMRLEAWSQYIPTELSGGQQQKISLARALINSPEVIVADEPTGNLDYAAGQEIMALLKQLNTEEGKTVIMVTHDLEYLTYANSAIRMFDGEIVGIYDKDSKQQLIEEVQLKRGSLANEDTQSL